MSKQASGGNKKRKRRPRAAHKILKQEQRKEKWLAKLKSDKTAQRRKSKSKYSLKIEVPRINEKRHFTLDELYKTYRKTKGRQGLNPNPKTRQDENLWVIGKFQKKQKDGRIIWSTKQHYLGGRFPITSLMEKPIQYSKPENGPYYVK